MDPILWTTIYRPRGQAMEVIQTMPYQFNLRCDVCYELMQSMLLKFIVNQLKLFVILFFLQILVPRISKWQWRYVVGLCLKLNLV